jgi:vacuolar-type H+-ATPase subunit E/Vma4
VQGGDEIILFSRGEKYLTPEWVDKFNKANSTRLTVSEEPGNFTGGFILSNGRIRINCTFEMLIQVAQERLESEVVHRLFSD